MTLLSGLVVACLSASPDSMRWRALRAARSLMAFGMEGESLSAAALAPPLAAPLLLLARSHASPELPGVSVALLSWLEVELGVVGDSSSFSSLSTGSSGMARGSSSHRRPLTAFGPSRLGLFRLPSAPCPWPPSSSEEIAKRGISMIAEQQRLLTVRGGLESLSVWEDSETDKRFRRISGDPTIQDRSLDLSPLRLSMRSPPSSLRLRLVGGGVLFSSCRDKRSMLLYTLLKRGEQEENCRISTCSSSLVSSSSSESTWW